MATEDIEASGTAAAHETAPEPTEPQGRETEGRETQGRETEGRETEGRADTGAAARVRAYPVAPGVQLNVRSGPGTQYRIVRTLPLGTTVPIYCQRPGESVSGPYGTSNIWDCIANAQYVSDAYVKTGSDGYVAPRCS
ncbi:SH3 domain-containing protein [Streptomyces sp. NPDC088789]|uniref:SH3 domain-containing protein n=1 Tax=Streptomyces sp. NPDC088789 TaxID=3365899 RepID=UPI00380CB1BF